VIFNLSAFALFLRGFSARMSALEIVIRSQKVASVRAAVENALANSVGIIS
jgi:hypothetical protein